MSKARFAKFIAQAAKCGLPVGFLRAVLNSSYSIKQGSTTAVSPWFDTMTLEPEELASVEGMALETFTVAVHGITNLYHEGVHAWVDINSARPDVARLAASEANYYLGAPMDDGDTAHDPPRVFQEAIASYVGHRASSYWLALGLLTALSKSLDEPNRTDEVVDKYLKAAKRAKRNYETAMLQRTFGYEFHGWLGWRKESETSKTVSGALKAFADQALLENRIPDSFLMSGRPAEIWTQLQRKYYPRLN
jgi:hypothetical protein